MQGGSDQVSIGAKLVCEDSTHDDNSVILLGQVTMDALQLYRGDTVIINSKDKSTVGIILDGSPDCAEGGVMLHKIARQNLHIQLGDSVTVNPIEISYGHAVHVLPFEDTVRGVSSGDLFDTFLKPYFLDAYRPVKKGDSFVCRSGNRDVEFKVIDLEGACRGDAIIVAPDTTIHCEGKPLKRGTLKPYASLVRPFVPEPLLPMDLVEHCCAFLGVSEIPDLPDLPPTLANENEQKNKLATD